MSETTVVHLPEPTGNQLAEIKQGPENPAKAYIASLTSQASRTTMERALNDISHLLTDGVFGAYEFPWERLRAKDTGAIRALLADRCAPATANKKLAALRGVLKEAWRMNLLSTDDYMRAVDIKGIKGSTLPKGRMLSEGEKVALSKICSIDPTPAGIRDAAIIGLMVSAGPRRDEVTHIMLDHFNPSTGEVRIIRGKGRKDRIVYIDNGALHAMKDWLQVRGNQPGPLFCPVNKGGIIEIRSLTSQAVYNMLRKRAKQAGVESFSPHDMRRTVASELIEKKEAGTAQKFLGHSNISTTMRYDRRPEEEKRKAASLLHFPYFKPAFQFLEG